MPWPSGGLRTWVAGETVTADQLNEQLRDTLAILKTYVNDDGTPAWIQSARQSGDVTKNGNVTFADLTGLSFTVGANETWEFEAALWAQAASATPGMKFQATGPASPTEVLYGVVAADGAQITAGYISGFSGTIAITKGTIDGMIVIRGIVRNGANAGVVQLQFAQSTSNASNSVVKAGSRIRATRLF